MSAADEEMARAARLAGHLPGVEVSTWHRTSALKVAGRSFARWKAPGVLVVLCPLGLKEALIEAEPEVYFETAHYRGWPAMLIHLDAIEDERLQDRLECAWREKAPKKLLDGMGSR